ncbi:MAG: Qat anti-phage system QueC-like protein QatC [Vicinamibacterales bacterium]
MSKHLLIARLGVTDTVHVPASGGEVVTELQMLNTQTQLAHGLSDTVKELLKQGVYPSPLGVDLLLTAALVYAADTRISRASESEDTWTREIRLVVPVVELDRWTAIQELLSETLNFLTGDLWTIRFRSAVGLPRIIPELPNGLAAPATSTVSLFSGGLDSLIGAVDLLQRGETPIFVSHAGDGATSKAQQECFDALATRYGRAAVTRFRFWLAFPHNLVQGTVGEDTTRARSFLFFALAASVGSGLNRPVVIRAPENGLIALNVPLDPLRLGALSTRTTHPYYIARWNEMLSRIGLPCTVENPYRHLTKGEMALNCGDRDFLREIVASSLSCSSPSKARWQSRPTEHCGYCTPCLIRRAALEKAFGRGGDPTTYTIANLSTRPLDSEKAEGQQVRSFQLAIEKLRRRPALASFLIHKPGPLTDVPGELEQLADVYRRGMHEVNEALSGVVSRPQ